MYSYDSRFVTVSCFMEQTVSSIIYRCHEEGGSPTEALVHTYNILDNNCDAGYEEPEHLKARFNDIRQLKNKDPQLIAKFYPRAEAAKLLEDEKYLRNIFIRLVDMKRRGSSLTEYSEYSSDGAKTALKKIKLLQDENKKTE